MHALPQTRTPSPHTLLPPHPAHTPQVLTPDLKAPGASRLLHVDLAAGRRRLGGSALAQAYGQVGAWLGGAVCVCVCMCVCVCVCAAPQGTALHPDAIPHSAPAALCLLRQVGDACPDVDPALLGAAFNATQRLIAEGRLLAGHDISDGGIATAVSWRQPGRPCRRRWRCWYFLLLLVLLLPLPCPAAAAPCCCPLLPRHTSTHSRTLPCRLVPPARYRRSWRWPLPATAAWRWTCLLPLPTPMASWRYCLPRSWAGYWRYLRSRRRRYWRRTWQRGCPAPPLAPAARARRCRWRWAAVPRPSPVPPRPCATPGRPLPSSWSGCSARRRMWRPRRLGWRRGRPPPGACPTPPPGRHLTSWRPRVGATLGASPPAVQPAPCSQAPPSCPAARCRPAACCCPGACSPPSFRPRLFHLTSPRLTSKPASHLKLTAPHLNSLLLPPPRLPLAPPHPSLPTSAAPPTPPPTPHYTPHYTPHTLAGKVRVAILREEGSNGDREMAAAGVGGGHGALGPAHERPAGGGGHPG